MQSRLLSNCKSIILSVPTSTDSNHVRKSTILSVPASTDSNHVLAIASIPKMHQTMTTHSTPPGFSLLNLHGPPQITTMSPEDIREQNQRILQASVDQANRYIRRLNGLILKQRNLIENVAAALEQVNKEKAEVLLRFAETELEVFRLQHELRKVRGESEATADGQEGSNAEAMVRQNGYMGHADRPDSR